MGVRGGGWGRGIGINLTMMQCSMGIGLLMK